MAGGCTRDCLWLVLLACVHTVCAAPTQPHLMLPKLDWLDAVVNTDGGDVLADELFLAVPVSCISGPHASRPCLLLGDDAGCLAQLAGPGSAQTAHRLIRQDLPVPRSPMDRTLILTTLLRAVWRGERGPPCCWSLCRCSAAVMAASGCTAAVAAAAADTETFH